MKIYKFSITRTDEYFFSIKAKDRETASDKLLDMDLSEADSHKNLDISTEFFGAEEIEIDPADD